MCVSFVKPPQSGRRRVYQSWNILPLYIVILRINNNNRVVDRRRVNLLAERTQRVVSLINCTLLCRELNLTLIHRANYAFLDFKDTLNKLVHTHWRRIGRYSKRLWCFSCVEFIPHNRLLNLTVQCFASI